MMAKLNAIIKILLIFLSVASTAIAEDAIFSEIVLPFKEVKYFDHSYDAKSSTLNITIYKTNSTEIESLYNYDPNVINRVIIKDTRKGDVEIAMVLKAQKLRALVYSFDEPFRIVIDIFNKAQVTGRKNNLINEDGDLQRYKLLSQAKVGGLESVNQKELEKIKPGLAKGWANFPIYIYRNFNIAFDKRKSKVKLGNDAKQIAEKANNYFQYGDENKALYLYKTLLYKHSKLFDSNPEHLWNVAEIYLGNDKIHIAKSYYMSLIEKFPGTEFSKYAKQRLQDIESLKAIDSGNLDLLPRLSNQVESIETSDPELQAEKLIREVYWNQNIKENYSETISMGYMPKSSYGQYSRALALRSKIIHPKTKFLLDTIVASFQLSPEYKWTKKSLNQILSYAKQYDNYYNGSFSKTANNKALMRLTEVITKQFKLENYINVVEIYDSIPNEIAVKPEDFETSWAIAYSYNEANMYDHAAEMFEHARQLATIDSDILKSDIYAIEAYKNALDVGEVMNNSAMENDVRKRIKITDAKLIKDWNASRATSKTQIYNLFNSQLLENLNSPEPTKSYLLILSDLWNAPLEKSSVSLGPNKVSNLIILKEKLKNAGLKKEVSKTEKTLLKLDIGSINTSLDNEDIWATEMSKYANNLRLDDRYYESAKAYKEIADKTRNWVNRAESYYKSGLLFYKAGKRSEAISAFEKASNIKDSSLYSKLAQDRLDQIQE